MHIYTVNGKEVTPIIFERLLRGEYKLASEDEAIKASLRLFCKGICEIGGLTFKKSLKEGDKK